MRKMLIGMMLAGVFFLGGCDSSDDKTTDPVTAPTPDPAPAKPTTTDVAGLWKMTATTPTVYTFDLSLSQSGAALTGSMDSTNTGDPTDSISGSITSAGKITFTRKRVGHWTQVYSGTVNSSTSMGGTFTHTPGTDGPFPWIAVR